jgi:predicted DNA-binding transcriptional regulator AlpA
VSAADSKPVRLLDDAEVRARLGNVSRSTRQRLQRVGFPKPLRVSPGRIAWREADVDRWINERTELPPQERA